MPLLWVCALIALLPGCSGSDVSPPAGSAIGSATSSAPTEAPDGGFTALPSGGKELQPLQPGRYGLTANGSQAHPVAVVSVPAGLSTVGGFAVGVYDGDLNGQYHALSYWTVSGVYADPCGKRGGLLSTGSSVESLAHALASQDLTRTTAPRPITINGHEGLQLDMIAPDDVTYEDCVEGYFDVWDSSPGGGRYMQTPGQLLRLRIVDVDGSPVVLETTAVRPAGTAGLAEMDLLATMVTFEDPLK